MNHRPVCVACKREMFPAKNDIRVVDMVTEGTEQNPLEMWCADLWQCPACGTQVVVGFGAKAFEHWAHPNFIAHIAQERKNNLVIESYE